MSFSTFVAKRYMKTNAENRFFSWIAVLSIAGMAIGVAAMIVVLSVINGFETELRNRFLAANAHVLAYSFPHGLTNHAKWTKTIKRDYGSKICGISPFVHYETMARKDSLMHATLIRGISPKLREKVQGLRSLIEPPEALDILQSELELSRRGQKIPQPPAIIVGAGLLSLLDAKLGDFIQLVSPEQQKTSDMKPMKIVGVYDSGLKHYDNKLGLMSISTAQQFFSMGKRVTGLEIGLNQPWDSPEIAEEMSNSYSLSIREWQSFNSSLFEAMNMERVVIGCIVFLVGFVASFNILTTLFISVSQKQRDISVLKALGANNLQIQALFVKQGIYIGIVGSIIGVILAVIISKLLETYQFIDLPDLYLLAKLPIAYDWRVYSGVCLAGVSICIAAGLYPAWVASRVNPTEGIRGTHNTV